MAEGIEPQSGEPCFRLLEGVGVVTLRHLPGDVEGRPAAEGLGLAWVTAPGEMVGVDPLVVWRTPHEVVFVGRDRGRLDALLACLGPGRHDLALAVDIGESVQVIELDGPGLDAWLAHLVDSAAIPTQPGRATRLRLVDVPVQLLRLGRDRIWLLVERPLAPYVANWLGYSRLRSVAPARGVMLE